MKPANWKALAMLSIALSSCGAEGPRQVGAGDALAEAPGQRATVLANVADGEPREASAQGIAPAQAETLCTLLTPDEIEAAFNGAIQVVVESDRARLCRYGVVEHEGQLLLQRMDAQTYHGRKSMYSSGSYGDIEPVSIAGLGVDAYSMGDAQVEVQVDENEAFNLALTLLTRGEPPFTPEQGRAALVELAGTAAGRL